MVRRWRRKFCTPFTPFLDDGTGPSVYILPPGLDPAKAMKTKRVIPFCGRHILWRALGLCVLLAFSCVWAQAADTNGFAVRFTSTDEKASDTMVLPNLWLYVEEGKPAAPFIPAGKFTATFEGMILGELRASYIFKAEELSGSLKLEINNNVVLEASAPGALSKPIQINKGPNAVKATFTPPAKGDAFLRVGWTEKGTNVNPIPNLWIAHVATPELQKAQMLHLGRELFLENRCVRCHTEKFASSVPDLAMDAPSFAGMGARRNRD